MTTQELMKALGCSEAEAQDIIKSDKAIDKGERVYFDFDIQKEKEMLKEAHRGIEKATGKAKKPKKVAENTEKTLIIAEIATFLFENPKIIAENVEILNKNREISFNFKGKTYSITLTEHRGTKN